MSNHKRTVSEKKDEGDLSLNLKVHVESIEKSNFSVRGGQREVFLE